MTATCVTLWLDHEKFGCGQRDYVAIVGRKWVRLVEVATGASASIPLDEFIAAVRQPLVGRQMHLKPGKVAKRLRRNAKTFGNAESQHVKRALKELRS